MGVNGHNELEWRRQSQGWFDERQHHRPVVLSRLAVGLVSAVQSEAAGAVVSRFEGDFLSVARGAWLSFATSL
ncbi:hypothetical protein IGI04_002530, partial [Brassica rapa subsp. trilocularis]